ncbi:MAG: polysaccharide deacetylase family protein [bacterium]|nr:polysaccharide deacetylase family protein [bacterium]
MFNSLCDWVNENYEVSYIVGVGTLALTAWALDPKKRSKRAWGAFAAAVALGVALEPCVNVQSQTYGPVLSHGSRQSRQIALTFDDGPSEYTAPLLDVLAEEGVKATFFCVGKNVLQHPDLVRRAHDEGHLVATHSYSHRNLLGCLPAASRREINAGAQALDKVLGYRPQWFRPPYGMRYPWTLLQARQAGLSTVLWSNCPRDWLKPGAKVIARRVISDLQPGDIVLLHDGGGDRSQTVVAVRFIIRYLSSQGYKFVRVDELIRESDV